MKKPALIIAGILLVSIMVVHAWSLFNRPDEADIFDEIQRAGAPYRNAAAGNAAGADGSQPAESRQPGADQSDLSLDDRLVRELTKYYGSTISEKSTQALLLKVKEFIVNLYPEDGEARFYSILKRAFPELADEIMVTLDKLETYNRWLEENKLKLAGMSELERKGVIWEKRRELFGAEAEAVWSEELFAYEKRKQTMKETMRLLDESYDTTIEEKLDIYMSTLQKTYRDSPEAYTLENKGLLAKVFFGIDSVQKELKKMSPEHRQWEINQIRREMGYTEEQIRKAEEIDEYRNSRWDRGLAYMEEREALANQYSGDELEEKLDALRKEYFKHEAKTIALEEKDGFFRYKRPRVHGRN